MNIDLTGKRAAVCGSTQGIGKATAFELARLGADIVLIARNQTVLESMANELSVEKGQKHHFIAVDFAETGQLQRQINEYASDHFVHILVNNTGGPPGGPAFEAKADEFIAAFANHLLCNQILTQALVPGMKAEGYGRIINIISTSVKQPINGLGVSNTIRGAVANWSKTLANELGPFGVTVNNILPGATNTGRLQSIVETSAAKTGKPIEETAELMKASIPARRFAEPTELAYAIAFLASPSAAYINGINLPVDGGRTSCL